MAEALLSSLLHGEGVMRIKRNMLAVFAFLTSIVSVNALAVLAFVLQTASAYALPTPIYGNQTPIAANNASLSGYSVASGIPSVSRQGFSFPGDAPPMVYNASTSACSLNAGAGDGGSQVPSADGKCWVANLPAEGGDIRIWGANANGAADATAAVRAAIAAMGSNPVLVPAGTFVLTDMISLNSGQQLRCAGRTRTYFKVDSVTFNMSASGVVSLGSTEPGGEVYDCGIKFVQPDTTVRANIIKYPPAISARNAPRFIIDRVRVENAWRCLDAGDTTTSTNSGGARIGILECGGYNDVSGQGNISIDGSLDFIHIESIECWPYGTTKKQRAIIGDQKTICSSIGRVDGLSVSNFSTFKQKVEFNSSASLTKVPYSISNLQADGDGASVVQAGGNVNVSNWYSTKSGASTDINNVALVSAGSFYVSNAYLSAPCIMGACILINGGDLSILKGYMNLQNSAAQHFMNVTAGKGSVSNFYVYSGSATPPHRTAAVFRSSSTGIIKLVDNTVQDAAGATGAVISIANDNADNYIAGNLFNGWSHSLPATALGYYDMAEPETLTATPQFSTNGDFSPTVTALVGNAYRKGNFNDVSFDLMFNTNAYTTASGAFRVYLGDALPAAKQSHAPCTLHGLGKANFTGQVGMFIQGTSMFFELSTSGNAIAGLGTRAFPASGTGYEVRVACRYAVR